jgi:hypothetical protein
MPLHHSFFGNLQSAAEPTPDFSTKSFNFDGTDDYINIGNVSELDFVHTDPFSVSAWVKTSSATYQSVVNKILNSSPYTGYQFAVKSDGNIQADLVGTGTLRKYTTSANVSNGSFHHIVWTYDGSTNASGVKFYVDGSEVTSTTTSYDNLSTSISNSDPFCIGMNPPAVPFTGNIDDVSVWNKELSASEVTELYNAGKPFDLSTHSAAANLVGFWLMGDDPSDDATADTGTIIDQTVNSNDGTPKNTEGDEIEEDTP